MRDLTRPSYTPEEAERALPLVRAIARDAYETYARVQADLAQFNDFRSLDVLTSDQSLPPRIRDDLGELRDLMLELDELGARFGDPELGLILLDGRLDDRHVVFCWKLGESEIRYWYPLDGTYEDRRPLPRALAPSA